MKSSRNASSATAEFYFLQLAVEHVNIVRAYLIISTESKNIMIRHFYNHAEEKLRPKRAASEIPAPENGRKHPRASTSDPPH
ncbi:hypothetical protein Nepgr_011212 [Nepenthes gracilis]|uniref:Uncharacterized protein n=1 Tax=Nepenthes gracilis TaxID=150966 RepID=A0AAD3SEX6_NEPGR|nr:hypothetical protein Nepgr_011212 [Nepenthes gracilis]